MELLREHVPNKVPSLRNADATIKFIRRMSAIIKAMNSRCKDDALRRDSESLQTIRDFILYMIEWDQIEREYGSKILTRSTSFGLRISLNATLEIFEFLCVEHGYEYLMTVRLNQDALERFFSLRTFKSH